MQDVHPAEVDPDLGDLACSLLIVRRLALSSGNPGLMGHRQGFLNRNPLVSPSPHHKWLSKSIGFCQANSVISGVLVAVETVVGVFVPLFNVLLSRLKAKIQLSFEIIGNNWIFRRSYLNFKSNFSPKTCLYRVFLGWIFSIQSLNYVNFNRLITVNVG